jgi:moderate conductance mechanosensitive channel
MNIPYELILGRLLFTLGVLISTLILSYLLKKSLDIFFNRIRLRITSERTITRTTTLKNLFKNVLDITLLLTALLTIMSYWGINIMPILTGAGILGLAISFGAQTFIKDVIAGVFIILEDQFHIGDKVRTGELEGEVVSITLRLTVLQDKTKNMIYIPNSQITTLIRLEGKKPPLN